MFLSLGKISFWEILPHCPQFCLVICWNPECFGIFKAIMIFFRHQVKVTLYQTLIHPNLIKICVYNVLSKNHIQRRKCRNPNFFPPETSKIRTRKWKKTWFWEKNLGTGTTALAPALILITVIRNTVTSLKVVYLIGDTILMIWRR